MAQLRGGALDRKGAIEQSEICSTVLFPAPNKNSRSIRSYRSTVFILSLNCWSLLNYSFIFICLFFAFFTLSQSRSPFWKRCLDVSMRFYQGLKNRHWRNNGKIHRGYPRYAENRFVHSSCAFDRQDFCSYDVKSFL